MALAWDSGDLIYCKQVYCNFRITAHPHSDVAISKSFFNWDFWKVNKNEMVVLEKEEDEDEDKDKKNLGGLGIKKN